MSKLNLTPRIPEQYSRGHFTDMFRDVENQVNQLSEGQIVARYASKTAAPVIGDYKQGDLVYNTAPSELGTASSKYVILGWVCVASGTPGTWKECRVLTGN